MLDAQLQRQIRQFSQTPGLVRAIDASSAQLREALTGVEARIIVTTLQKFPVVLGALDGAGLGEGRRYAVVVDEAHSSQTGESARAVKQVLGSATAADRLVDEEDLDGVPPDLVARLAARGRQPNLSFFAFTATPKARTIELFAGARADAAGAERPVGPFHVYSMRQAIDEGFIIDVLRNYTTYDQFHRLEAKADVETLVPKGQAASRIARYASFHPWAKDQRADVVVEHFRRSVRPQLDGRGKAMVVCASREEAVEWHRALRAAIERTGATDVRVLVAFSGEVTVEHPDSPLLGASFTEPRLNAGANAGVPLQEPRLPALFDTPEFGILVVAEKYQTGFDQPRLVGMYVDKPLTGVNAVQTLSRLNRATAGKTDVWVLDFVNDADDILDAFRPFYETTLAQPTDPNELWDRERAMVDHGVVTADDVTAFIARWRVDEVASDAKRNALVSRVTQAPFDRTRDHDADARRDFRTDLSAYLRAYAFLSQVVPYLPPRAEATYELARLLDLRLGPETGGTPIDLAGAVDLRYFRLEQSGFHVLTLEPSETDPLRAFVGTGVRAEEEYAALAEIIDRFNATRGTEFTKGDLVEVIGPLGERLAADGSLADQLRANPLDDVASANDAKLIGVALEHGDLHDQITRGLVDSPEMRAEVMRAILSRELRKLEEEPA